VDDILLWLLEADLLSKGPCVQGIHERANKHSCSSKEVIKYEEEKLRPRVGKLFIFFRQKCL